MRRLLSLIGLLAGLGCGAAQARAQIAPVPVDPGRGLSVPPAANASLAAFESICLAARARPNATAKAAVAAKWTPIPAIAIAAMGGTGFEDAVGFRAPREAGSIGPQVGAAAQGVWVIIGRTPMPGFAYLADSCAVFAAPADASLAQTVRAWAGGAPTVDDPSQQLIQYAFTAPDDTASPPTRAALSIEDAAPGLRAGTISLVTVVPGAKRSVLVYSVVNP